MKKYYRLAALLPPVESSFSVAKDDDQAKEGAAKFLHDQQHGTYLLVTSDPDNGKHAVVATYEVKTTTNVAEVLARFEL